MTTEHTQEYYSENANFPDWSSAPVDEVNKAIFAQIRDFDETVTSGSGISPSLKGIKAYTGRGNSSMQQSNNIPDVDITGQLGVSVALMKMNFNVTAMVIDTLTAKLASIEAVPQAVTFKGTSKGRKLAEDLNFLLKGLFHKYDLTHLLNIAFRDAMVNRTGYLKVIKEDDEVCIDRLYADEIIVDNADGYYNKPYKMIHRKAVPMQVMIDKYPEHEEAIKQAQIKEYRQYNKRNYTPHIIVAEAWCKNTYKPKGRHVIVIDNQDLIDEEWDKDYIPILKCDYNEPIIGWQGSSVVDDLHPLQQEIDRLLITIQAILKLMSVPRVFVDSASDINKNHFTNKVGLIITYNSKQGLAPIIHNGASLPPELMEVLEFMISQAYARAGLTPIDTQGQAPTGSGNQSGQAMNTMTEIKAERWRYLQHNYEAKHVELAQLILDELQGSKIKISALDRIIGLKEVSTKVIPKTRDSFVLKMFPISSLPEDITEKIQAVTQLNQMGIIPTSMLPDLFDMPDLDAKISMISARNRLVDKLIEDMMDTGVYENPEPYYCYDNYPVQTANQHYCWGKLNGVEESKLALLRRFMNDCSKLIPIQPPVPQGVKQ